jgi:enoyl-CoA hydratase/carnithine racemase
VVIKLVRLIGRTKALRMLWQATALSAKEALDLGLVEAVCEPDKLMNTAMELAKDLAMRAPIAVGVIKLSVNAAEDSLSGTILAMNGSSASVSILLIMNLFTLSPKEFHERVRIIVYN